MTVTPSSAAPSRARTRGRRTWAWALAAGGLLVLNLVHFLTRSWEDSYLPSNYATIYTPTDLPTIREWRHVDDGLELVLRWSVRADGWRILRDGEPYAENTGPNPRVPVVREETTPHVYTAIPQPDGVGPPLEFRIVSISAAYSDSIGLPRPNAYYIRTNESNARFPQYAVSDWVDDYTYLGAEALAQIDTLLHDEMGIEEADTDLVRLEKIMAHLHLHLGKSCRGSPSNDSRWQTPWEIYQLMLRGEAKGWCTQYGQIFVMFANRAGVPSRLVVTARTEGNATIFTGHTWSESWIAEQGRWAWGDPVKGLVYATDARGQLLNTMELARLRPHGAWHGVDARVFKDFLWPELEGTEHTFVSANFDRVRGVVENQFNRHAIFKWRRPPNVEDLRSDYTQLWKDRTFFWGNLERYYFKPPLALADYPMEGRWTYAIRHLLLWSFLIAMAGWGMAWIRGRKDSP